MDFETAHKIAERVKKQLAPACSRIEIAGSIRRYEYSHTINKEVKDIEIVVIPKDHHLFSHKKKPKAKRKMKMTQVDSLLNQWVEKKRIRIIKDGPKMKQFMLIKQGSDLIKVDLFLVVPPASWGVIFTLRTGPASFSKWLVTYRKPQGYKFQDGQIWRKIQSISGYYQDSDKEKDKVWMPFPTPEEEDVFKALNIDFIPIPNREEY